VNHLVRDRTIPANLSGAGRGLRLGRWLLTFAAVTIAWAFFRADSIGSALVMTEGMLGMHGVAWPSAWWQQSQLAAGAAGYRASGAAIVILTALVAFVRLAPNTQQIMARFDVALTDPLRAQTFHRWYHWRLTPLTALAAAALFAASIGKFHDVTPFLYFQF
jgi:alginate O-acetyltransferase complex protein AlgI